ncbi:MAG: glycosyltransferase family 39 protein [Cyanobacteria bacterium SID2]|nr:glycosyltransferase family 39 protein [Cyanobacteria bacterium SID2]MBP0005692.1 glycosyltransferase family 39 protein [Cyanobacteria bacterium SBC]
MNSNFRNAVRLWWNAPEKFPSVVWGLSLSVLLVAAVLAFVYHLGSTNLIDETEPLFAEAARQMTVTGDWITPYFNGETRFDKPPLVYWLMAIGYLTIGTSEWAARLPSALSAIELMGLTFATLWRFVPPASPAGRGWLMPWSAGTLAAVAIAFNPQTIVWGRTGVSDMLLCAGLGSSLLSFFWGYASEGQTKQRWYGAFFVFAALAVLTKGPIGIVLPALIVAAFLLYAGNWKTVLREMRPLRGILLFLAMTVPWYLLVMQANGEAYIESFFGYHNFDRFTRVVNNHSAPWYFYFGVVSIGFAPWSVYLPASIARLGVWHRREWQQLPRPKQLGGFALVWFAGVFLFFTAAVTKLPSYVLPLIPAAAILVSLLLSEELLHRPTLKRGWLLVSHWLSFAVWVAMAIALATLPLWIGKDPVVGDIDAKLFESRLTLWGSGVAIAIAMSIEAVLLSRHRRSIAVVHTIGFAVFLTLVIHPTFEWLDRWRAEPMRELAEAVNRDRRPGEELMALGFKKPSLVFYTQQPVEYLSRPSLGREYLRERVQLHPELLSTLAIGDKKRLRQLGLRDEQFDRLEKVGRYRLIRVYLDRLDKYTYKDDD